MRHFGRVVVVALVATAAVGVGGAPAGAVSEEEILLASDGAGADQFGTSADVDGDTAVVGAPFDDVGVNTDQGTVYVYTRVGTAWTQEAQLFASDGAAGDNFGQSVSVDGDTIVVGAPDDNGQNATDRGSVYVFTKVSGVWGQRQKKLADDGAAGDLFGWSVSLDGQTFVAGAPGDNTFDGAGYTFVRGGRGWTQQAKLPFAPTGPILMGNSVSIDGNTAALGAPNSSSSSGTVHVFTRSGTTWSFQQTLNDPDNNGNDLFGLTVRVSGDTLASGAYGADNNKGAAYVFTRTGTVWTQRARLVASDRTDDDFFGAYLDLEGPTLAVGAPHDGVTGNPQEGSVYQFTRSGLGWTERSKIAAADGGPDDMFGAAVALSGDTLVVGSPGHEGGTTDGHGAAFVFTGMKPTVSLGDDVAITEGTGTTVTATFTVTLAWPSNGVTLTATGVDGTAVAPADYTGGGAVLGFGPGQTTRKVSVPITTDAIDEPNEVFYLVLSSANGATIGDGVAMALIIDDD